MPESYGVVVEKYNSSFGVWLLFRGIRSALTSLNDKACIDRLRVGDIVRAMKDEDKTTIRRAWPFPDSIWSDRGRVVVRSIISFDREITIDRGTWTDDVTGLSFILLVSRDLGIVVAPVQWYNREFYEANESHLLVYTQFLARKLSNTTTGESMEVFWSVIEHRVSLPVVPSKEEEPNKFLNADHISNVPILTLFRRGNRVLTWSYALGDHLAIIKFDRVLEIGKWLMATVIRSSTRDFKTHGCSYTVVKKVSVSQYTQPEVTIDNGKISMVLTLNRCLRESNNPEAGMKLWHDRWGLPVGYDHENAKWIHGEAKEFRATVEVVVGDENELDGCRASIIAIGPAAMPRLKKDARSMADSPSSSHAFEDVHELKKALEEKGMQIGHSETVHDGDDGTRSSVQGSQSEKAKEGDGWHSHRAGETTSTVGESEAEWKKRMIEMEKEEDTRSVAPMTSSTDPNETLLDTQTNVGPIPIRALDDERTEEKWRKEMMRKGWKMQSEGLHLTRKIIFEPELARVKKRKCLITKVRFEDDWKYANSILLFLVDEVPSYLVHDMKFKSDKSRIAKKAEFTTVGNVVEVNVRRGGDKYEVHDEMWRLMPKLNLPMKEVIWEAGRIKKIELIVTARCLSPEVQDKYNYRNRYDKRGFTMLNHELLHNIGYFGRDINAKDYEKYTYQMVVEPEECIEGHAFWRAKEILWKIKKETFVECDSSEPDEPLPPMPQEIKMCEIFEMFDKLLESEKVLEALHLRTGTDYKKKFLTAIEVARSITHSYHEKKSDQRDLDANANFLISIVENAYSEEIFRKMEERRLWKTLVQTVNLIKTCRRTVNHRWK